MKSTIIILLALSFLDLNAQSELPQEFIEKSNEYWIESSQSATTLLLATQTDYFVRVGKWKSTKIINQSEDIEKINEHIKSLDVAGGLWNIIFRGGKEFSSEKKRVSGIKTTFTEFSMKEKKEIKGSVTSVMRYAYQGNIRYRNTSNSQSKMVTDFSDTLAIISQITLPADDIPWHMEFLQITGIGIQFLSGTVIHGSDVFLFSTCNSCNRTSRSFILSQDGELMAGVELSMFPQLHVLTSLSVNDQIAFGCLAATLKNSFDVVDTTR